MEKGLRKKRKKCAIPSWVPKKNIGRIALVAGGVALFLGLAAAQRPLTEDTYAQARDGGPAFYITDPEAIKAYKELKGDTLSTDTLSTDPDSINTEENRKNSKKSKEDENKPREREKTRTPRTYERIMRSKYNKDPEKDLPTEEELRGVLAELDYSV